MPGGERAVGGGATAQAACLARINSGASRMQGRARLGVGARVGTRNISSMRVTPDVSKLSGWLKAANCWPPYEAGSGCGPGEVRGRWAGRGDTAQAACREGLGCEGRGEGTHQKHGEHACDAGRVEVQRLVEGIRALPSRKGGNIRSGGKFGPGCARAIGWAGLRSRMQGRARLEPQGEGTHRKHVFHGCDAGRVEVQRLVEGIRALPSREEVDNTIRDETVDEVRSGGA